MKGWSLALIAALLLWVGNARGQDSLDFNTLARQCAPTVHPNTLAAVIRNESAFNALAIGVNRGHRLPRQPATMAEAIATATYLDANGYSFDAGLGQINNTNVRKFGLAWADVFEPCANLKAAGRVLTECYVRASADGDDPQAALRDALSCYNTGTFTRGYRNGYVRKVERAAALPPAAVVPALLPGAASNSLPPTVAGTSQPALSAPPATPADGFGRGRGDAFARANMDALRADLASTLHEVGQGDTGPVPVQVIAPAGEPSPLRPVQSGGSK